MRLLALCVNVRDDRSSPQGKVFVGRLRLVLVVWYGGQTKQRISVQRGQAAETGDPETLEKRWSRFCLGKSEVRMQGGKTSRID